MMANSTSGDHDDGREGDRPTTVVSFPASERLSDEERAQRLKTEVERLARLPTVEWMFLGLHRAIRR
jgi:hypothetical protein